jgi:MFS family permease
MSINLITAEMRTNFRNLYADIFWYGILAGSTLAFVAIYATHQGASAFQVSLLTAGPALVNLVLSLPVGRWLEGRRLVRVTFWSSIGQRLGYLVMVILPWLLPAAGQVWALVLITVLISLPGTLLAISFNAMFADVVPPEQRANVVGRRNALLAFSMIATSLACGALLDWIDFPYNYQIVFFMGAVGALMSSYSLARLRTPRESPVRVWKLLNDMARPGLLRIGDAFRASAGLRFLTRSKGKPLLRLDLLRTSYGTFLLACLLFYTFQYLSVPIYPLFFVNQLHLTDGQIGLANAIFYTAMMLASIALSWLTAQIGHRWILILGALMYGLYPLLVGLAQNAALVWVASVAGGAAWALANGGLLNRLMERTPEDDRPAFMAFHNVALNLGIFCGSLAGPVLATSLGLRDGLLFSAGMRFLAGILFILWA